MNTTANTTEFAVGFMPHTTAIAMSEACFDELEKHIKYHKPTGIYDIELIQFFENIRDKIVYKGVANNGLCEEIYTSPEVHRHRKYDAMTIVKKYMPHKTFLEFWWPVCLVYNSDPEAVKQGFLDRVAFLNRIIEDLMCGV